MYHFKLFLEADIKHKGRLLVQTNSLAAMLKLADINFTFDTESLLIVIKILFSAFWFSVCV